MRFAADLHLHSRYAGGVSPAMTVPNIAEAAQRKGVDLLGTGDCLQAGWLRELEEALLEVSPGFFALRYEIEAQVWSKLPERLRCHLRYVLSTEVSCTLHGRPPLSGIHHLIYFPSFTAAREFATKVQRYGDLGEGRPNLRLTSRQLLELVLEQGDGCHLAPAHVFNPWFSALGTWSGATTLEELFGDLTPRLLAVETGLTSNPAMCRRVASLDRHALFSCSDAHSPDNIGRECTLVDIEPGYDSLFTALRNGSSGGISRTLKFPLEETRYYLNWCGHCRQSFEGVTCPVCKNDLVAGSRDRLETSVATRLQPTFPPNSPPFQVLLPLKFLIAGTTGQKSTSPSVQRLATALVQAVGSERYLLTEASEAEINQAGVPQIAGIILDQRNAPPGTFVQRFARVDSSPQSDQATLDFGAG
jgi:PHP family Zn ribbon phosphoesterase